VIDLTPDEYTDLYNLVDSGQAKLLRLSAQVSAKTAGERVLASETSVCYWERGRVPVDPYVRRRYYTFLCELRERLGEITVAYGTKI